LRLALAGRCFLGMRGNPILAAPCKWSSIRCFSLPPAVYIYGSFPSFSLGQQHKQRVTQYCLPPRAYTYTIPAVEREKRSLSLSISCFASLAAFSIALQNMLFRFYLSRLLFPFLQQISSLASVILFCCWADCRGRKFAFGASAA
jgi:hypothetical protein